MRSLWVMLLLEVLGSSQGCHGCVAAKGQGIPHTAGQPCRYGDPDYCHGETSVTCDGEVWVKRPPC